MMLVVISLIIVLLTLLAYVVVLHKKLRQTHLNLKKLIKENDGQQNFVNAKTDDIYFRINKDFIVTFISESGAHILGLESEQVTGKSVLGSLFEDTEANKEGLNNVLKIIARDQNTINSQQIILNVKGQKKLMLCRQRPLLNEVLKCEGISFLCKDISEAKNWEDNLSNFQNRDIFTSGLNEEAILKRFEHDFRLAKRYNKDFSCVAVELKDIYDFISKGIDFETADKLLKIISDLCFANLTPNAHIGRVDKTKIFMILNGTPREVALKIATKVMNESTPIIRKLGIDEYNAQMLVVSYTNRNGYNDTYDAMLGRLRRHIKESLRNREYGIISSDTRINVTKN